MKAVEEMKILDIKECPECHCNPGDDWVYKDFSNRNILICPQCKTELYLDDYRQKTFYFKIEGRIIAKNNDEATDFLYELFKNKTERCQITELEEVVDK
jgi:uncharacterized protein YbaR (Trm112 family)